MVDTNIINWDYDPDYKPDIVETMRSVWQAMKDHAEEEERKSKDPDYEYRRIHICSKEIAEIMMSPDTPLEVRRQLEWVTFVGYQWVHVGDDDYILAR